MAKKESTRAKGRETSDDDGEGIELSGPRRATTGKKVSARVKAGNRVILGETDDEGNFREVAYGPGSTVSLTEDEIAARPWAFEEVSERRSRGGQTTRLQKRVQELEAEIERLRSQDKQNAKTAKEGDPGRAAAVESIMARGSNYIGRGEPQIGSVPREVVDAYEEGRDLAALRAGGRTLDEETGFKGAARESAGASELAPGVTTPGARASIPSDLEPGESQRPGSDEPSSGE